MAWILDRIFAITACLKVPLVIFLFLDFSIIIIVQDCRSRVIQSHFSRFISRLWWIFSDLCHLLLCFYFDFLRFIIVFIIRKCHLDQLLLTCFMFMEIQIHLYCQFFFEGFKTAHLPHKLDDVDLLVQICPCFRK